MLTEYQPHDSLKKELQDLGVTRIPSSEKIQKRIESLEAQTSTILENQELQKKQQTLDIIQQNFTTLLDAPPLQKFIKKNETTL